MDSALIEVLAMYNKQVAEGLVHTKQWQASMAALQAEFDKERKKALAVANG